MKVNNFTGGFAVTKFLEKVLWLPVIAAVLVIAAIGVIDAWKFLMYVLQK